MKTFKDFYGSVATIKPRRDGRVVLKVRTSNGRTIINKEYDTERGARIAMGKCTDGGFKEVSNA